MSKKVIEIIKNRVSCRSFNDKRVPSTKLDQILEAGKYAPSGMNRQVCNILAVRKKSVLDKIKQANIDKFGRDLYNAGTLCIVYGKKDEPLVIKDGSCILENMFIAAASLKIDSCWINQVDDILNDPKYKSLRKLLNIPEDCVVIGSAALGYRKEDNINLKPRKEDFVRIL